MSLICIPKFHVTKVTEYSYWSKLALHTCDATTSSISVSTIYANEIDLTMQWDVFANANAYIQDFLTSQETHAY